MDNKCIASWLKNIKEKYVHGGDESLDDTRRLAIDTAIKRLEEQQNTIWELQELNEHLNDKLKKSEGQKFIAHEDGKIEPIPKVVRCNDCSHYSEDSGECLKGHEHGYAGTWFCADGELKVVEEGKKDFIVTRSITAVEGKPHVETISERELIKCKDCIYYTDCLCWNVPKNETPRPKEKTFFCADGKRKGGEHE